MNNPINSELLSSNLVAPFTSKSRITSPFFCNSSLEVPYI